MGCDEIFNTRKLPWPILLLLFVFLLRIDQLRKRRFISSSSLCCLFVVLLLPPSTDSFTLKTAIRHGTLFLFFSFGDPIAPLFLCLVLFRLERRSTAYYLWKRKYRNCPTILSELRECPRAWLRVRSRVRVWKSTSTRPPPASPCNLICGRSDDKGTWNNHP